MAIEPNERLLFEASQRRKSISEGHYKDKISEKGIREMAAMFAIKDSIQRGEQSDATILDPIVASGEIVDLVEKVIPPNMRGDIQDGNID